MSKLCNALARMDALDVQIWLSRSGWKWARLAEIKHAVAEGAQPQIYGPFASERMAAMNFMHVSKKVRTNVRT